MIQFIILCIVWIWILLKSFLISINSFLYQALKISGVGFTAIYGFTQYEGSISAKAMEL
jgi:hypothetical protein